jgi:hypothetical protein
VLPRLDIDLLADAINVNASAFGAVVRSLSINRRRSLQDR